MAQVLSLRQLNRATLQRQLLLQRATLPVPQAVEQVAGLQSQVANPPYIGLWSRLVAYRRDELTHLLESRDLVRVAMWRSTQQILIAEDHQRFREMLQPVLSKALRAFYGKRARDLPVEKLVALAQPFVEAEPRAMGDIRALLEDAEPDRAGDAMAYAVRNFLPLVQVPPSGTWGTGTRATYTTAEQWLGPAENPLGMRDLLWRYLRAFGPASVMDFQAWSGFTSLKKQIEPMKADLTVYETEAGGELLDVPGLEVPAGDAPAPVRYIPAFDNLLVSHKDRNRVIADDDRQYVFLSAGRVLPTILVDGFVSGTWATTRDKADARLVVAPFRPLDDEAVHTTLVDEGERLLRFIEDDAETFAVEIE